jgi:hypothetical protein
VAINEDQERIGIILSRGPSMFPRATATSGDRRSFVAPILLFDTHPGRVRPCVMARKPKIALSIVYERATQAKSGGRFRIVKNSRKTLKTFECDHDAGEWLDVQSGASEACLGQLLPTPANSCQLKRQTCSFILCNPKSRTPI